MGLNFRKSFKIAPGVKLNVSKKDSEMLRFSNRVEHLAGEDNGRKLENEKIFISNLSSNFSFGMFSV